MKVHIRGGGGGREEYVGDLRDVGEGGSDVFRCLRQRHDNADGRGNVRGTEKFAVVWCGVVWCGEGERERNIKSSKKRD